MNITDAIFDPELGYTGFSVSRTCYRRENGQSVPSNRTMQGAGCIHPGTPEMVQLLPEEERHEEFIAIYTDFPLSLGENDGGLTYFTPDRIHWNGKEWRVVRIRDWQAFHYCQALAVLVRE